MRLKVVGLYYDGSNVRDMTGDDVFDAYIEIHPDYTIDIDKALAVKAAVEKAGSTYGRFLILIEPEEAEAES